ncbi:MAG: 30S ribosomal protein S12 methylthiotransferase RimO [Bdellovibrionales bacterium]|nr:30S ribosomal protein S12 methylthiotransferase RimO [Bdellovibrionales bacterium]
MHFQKSTLRPESKKNYLLILLLREQKLPNFEGQKVSKKVHFISLGCPKNLVDSEIMLAKLQKQGYEVVEDPEEAEALIVNTCGFVEDAKRESINKILQASELKQTGQLQKLVVAGCLTQRYKDELVEGLPEADLFIGSGQFQNIDKILNDSFAGKEEKRFFNLPTYLQDEETPRVNSQLPHRAYLKISEGCKKRCAFCAIPNIRGNLQSRKLDHIVSEARLLVAGGVKELIIISHDFTDYGWDLRKKDPNSRESHVQLLKELSEKSGADWIRVLYLYPDGINEEYVDLIKSKENLLNYFDMPLQHINNQMLKSMNRRMTREEIEKAIKIIRSNIPDAIIRTQFIVGFPGETAEQFEELYNFVKEQKFDRVGCFIFSPEEGTKAYSLPDPVDEEVKQIRHDRLMSLQQEISREKQQQLLGKNLEVLVEGYSEETDLLLQARYWGQAPDIDGVTLINEGSAKVGDKITVEVTDFHDYDLVGSIVSH